MAELLSLLESWVAFHGVGPQDPIGSILRVDSAEPVTEEEFWHLLEVRPGTILGGLEGTSLQEILVGMTRGGDWLELPPLPRARDILERIEQESLEAYGSHHAIFRIETADRLLKNTGSSLDKPR